MKRSVPGTAVLSALASLVLTLAPSLASPARAADGGVISGTVVETVTSTPLAGITVSVLDPWWGTTLSSTITQADGTYSAPVAAGTYRMYFADPSGSHGSRFSGGAASWPESATIAVGEGGAVVEDAAMPLLAFVRGTITEPGGAPLANMRVELLDIFANTARETFTDAAGGYVLAAVPDGQYRLYVSDPSGLHGAQYWQDSVSWGTATLFDVVAGDDLVVDQQMHLAGSLFGSVSVGGAPVPNVLAAVFPIDGFHLVGIGLTDAAGAWTVGPLAPGDYKVLLVDLAMQATPDRALRPVFASGHDGLSDPLGAWNAAEVYSVSSSAAIDLGDAALVGMACDPTVVFPGADLSGQDLTGADLRACDLTDVNLAGATLTGADLAAATITAADLTDAVGLTRAQVLATNHDWEGTSLAGTDLDLSAIDFVDGGFTLRSASLRGLDLRNAEFVNSIFPAPPLFGPIAVDVGQVDFSDADLTGATFGIFWAWPAVDTVVSVTRTNMVGARLTGANLTNARVTRDQALTWHHDWSGTDFTGTNRQSGWGLTIGSEGCGSCYYNTTDRPIGFTNRDLTSYGLSGAVFAPAAGNPVVPFSFQNANLAGVDLSGAACTGCTFGGAQFDGADLSGTAWGPTTSVAGADYTGALLTGASIAGQNLSTAGGLTVAQLLDTVPVWSGARLPPIDLSGVDLTGRDLDHVDLTGVNLLGATVTGVDLSFTTGLTSAQLLATDHDWTGTSLASTSANLSGVDFAAGAHQVTYAGFENLDLSATNWTGVDITGTRFSGATLTGATGLDWAGGAFAGADLRGADLSGLDLTSANFSGADLSGANLSGANLTNAVLTNAALGDAGLSSAVLTGAVATGATLDGVDFLGATGATWASWLAAGSDLHGVNLSGQNLTGLNLTSANLSGANLSGVNFTNAVLTNALLSGSVLTTAVMTGSTLTGAHIEGADFTSATGLTKARITAANHNWTNTKLQSTGVSLASVNFPAGGYTLTGADLGALSLSNANLAGMDLTGIDLVGALLTGTVITGANLQGALIGTNALKATNHNWTGTNLSGVSASLGATDFAAGAYTLVGANFEGEYLAGANFTGLDLSGVRFKYANLTGATFQSATMTGTSIELADLTGAKLAGAALTGSLVKNARLTNATGLTVAQLVATDHNWTGTFLDGTAVDFSGFDFTGYALAGTNFTGLNLSGANLAGHAMSGARLLNANLSNANLGGVTGNPYGGSTAIYDATICPDFVVTNGVTVLSCVGHGLGT